MAAPTGNYATYDQSSRREDLEDIVYDISPMDTYFFTNAARKKASNTLHDWQTDALDTPVATNAFSEGDDFSGGAITATTKLRNYTQISRKDFVITDTANAVNTAGYKEELAYQTVRKLKALKRDIESAALQNKAASVGTSALARVQAGVETWINTGNHIKATGQTAATTPAPVAGIAATAPTDGSATAFIVADFQSALQQAWSMGGNVDVCLMGPALKAKADLFTGIATRFRNVNSGSQADIVNAADVFVSDFGSHKLVLSRYTRATTVLCMDMSMWGLAWLRPIKTVNIAKTGDSEKRMIVGEWCVVANNPAASTKIGNVS